MSQRINHLPSYILRETAEHEFPGGRTAEEITLAFNTANKAAILTTNAGQQAARRGIKPVARMSDGRKIYAAEDIPAIEKGLLALLKSRQKYGRMDGA